MIADKEFFFDYKYDIKQAFLRGELDFELGLVRIYGWQYTPTIVIANNKTNEKLLTTLICDIFKRCWQSILHRNTFLSTWYMKYKYIALLCKEIPTINIIQEATRVFVYDTFELYYNRLLKYGYGKIYNNPDIFFDEFVL